MVSAMSLSGSDEPWSRHELLRVAPAAWSQMLTSRPDLVAVPYLPNWVDRGWPVIVRRRVCGERADLVPIGVPLPPSAGKQRIGLLIPTEVVVERSPPPWLWTVRQAAGASWQRAIHDLVMLGARHAVTPTVIGGLFWQYRTGLTYLSPQSDLDVLWRAYSGCRMRSLLAGIEAIERAADLRIDGEVIFPDGRAVNWRELHLALATGGGAEVLIKSVDFAGLVDIHGLPDLRSAA
jgi:phosphoribosyl-dephospho-CoA transferase